MQSQSPALTDGANPARPAKPQFSLRRALIVLVVAVLPLPLVVPFCIGLMGAFALVRAPCGDSGQTPAHYGLPYRDVSIPSRSGGAYRGFFIPGHGERAEATILVPPPYSSGRGAMLTEAALLAKAGFSILMYESRICGGKGVLSLGYRDVEDIGDALAFLRQQAGVFGIDPARVALHGFSSAGAASLMAAARFPEIRGVLAEGGYHRLSEYFQVDDRDLMQRLMRLGIEFGYRASTGDDVSVLAPIDAIQRIPPRMVFLVYGSSEVTLAGARAKFAALRAAAPDARAALWVVPGADHGNYVAVVGPAEFARQTVPFYDCALFDRCAGWDAAWP